MTDSNAGARRRLEPRAWRDPDWLVMKQLRAAIEHALDGPAGVKAGQRVLDLGCGDRPYASVLSRRGALYLACDIDGDVDARITPGAPIPLPDSSADGIVSFQVLEHVWDLDWYLGECRRLLKPGGWLLLSTHGTWLYHPHPTDFRRWTRDGLSQELSSRGFVVEHTEAVTGPLAWTTVFRLLGIREVLRRLPMAGSLLLIPITLLMNLRIALEDRITPAQLRDANACVYVTVSRRAV
jgi:SAM-dependent methyltransferase